MEPIENQLLNKSISPTASRVLVLQYLIEQNKAISLNDLQEELDYADKSTLYRTLKTFEKNKLIHSIDDGTGETKYALCVESCRCEVEDIHYHFHCTDCQNTFCLTNLNLPTIDLPSHFSMQQANMVIKGKCANCNNEISNKI